MNVESYRERRRELLETGDRYRKLCLTCRQPGFGCYCEHVRPFNPEIKFAILIHPIEVKRRIATGRMSHLCLENSHLIMGQDYTDDPQVNQLIQDPRYQPVILYPGPDSINLTGLSQTQRSELFPRQKELLIFVIDGTWASARKMVRQSRNLRELPRISFSLETPSMFRVRKQPAPGCYSTIEAIHQTIELLGETQGFATQERAHDNLLHVFGRMVERQLEFIRVRRESEGASTYRRPHKSA